LSAYRELEQEHGFSDGVPRGPANNRARAAHPAAASWAKTTRLNPFSGIALCRDDPGVRETHERSARFAAEAATNIVNLLEASSARPEANLSARP